jgi:hypothetical protein
MNIYAVGGCLNAPAITEIYSRRGNFAIDAELQATGIGHAEARLVSNAVRSHSRSDGRIPAQATDKLIILDGNHYDFQGAGEFVTLLDPDGTEAQVRQSPAGGSRCARMGYCFYPSFGATVAGENLGGKQR